MINDSKSKHVIIKLKRIIFAVSEWDRFDVTTVTIKFCFIIDIRDNKSEVKYDILIV